MKSQKKSTQSFQKQQVPRRKKIFIGILVVILSGFIGYMIFPGKKDQASSGNSYEIPVSDSGIARGKALAIQYCQSCHMLPEPGLLDKTSWGTVLPQMGLKMGIKSHKGRSYEYADAGLAQGSQVPDHPAMNEAQWQNVIDYYTANSPAELPPPARGPIRRNLDFFSALPAPPSLSRKHLMITYVKIDNSVKPSRVFMFEMYSSQLFLLDHQLKVLDSVKTDGIIVDMHFSNNEILAVSMGNKLNMLDREKIGKVFPLTVSRSGRMQVKPPLFQHLAIPVQIIAADLNGDQRTDYLICEFGFLTGSLTWMENQGSGKYTRHVIRNFPGSVTAYVKTTAHNGLPDLWVLFAQGEEGVFHFTNKGNGRFEEKQVLRFPPPYGSTSMAMADMNHDGFEDIVYTCGDNGDFSRVLKPYHGVYIYINDGKYNFAQKYFFPIDGCYKVIAKDFRNSGNMDLALIGFFTDPGQPEESFVYLKNNGNLNFEPYTLPAGTTFERFLTMESGDLDGDAKPDLILGNTYPFPGHPGYDKSEPFFVVLKNLGNMTASGSQ